MKRILMLILLLVNIFTMSTFRLQKHAVKDYLHEQPKIVWYLPKRDEEIEYWMQ